MKVLLAAGGRCYLVLVQENKPAQIAKNLTAQGFEVEVTRFYSYFILHLRSFVNYFYLIYVSVDYTQAEGSQRESSDNAHNCPVVYH